MQPSSTWKRHGNMYSVTLWASSKEKMSFSIEASDEHEVDLVKAEVIGWQTMLEVMAGERPNSGTFKRSSL